VVRYADDFVVLVQGTQQDADQERQALAQFLKEELRMALSMEKTKITDVRDGFDFLGYRVAQEKMPSTGRHVGMLFIPKSKSQFLRDKIKAKVREMPTGNALADLIDDLNPVIIGWRNYYRYATRSGKEFPKLVAVLAPEILARQEIRQGVWKDTASCMYTESRAGEAGGWRLGGKKLARFADTKRLRYGDRGLRIPKGWNDPDERFRKGADKFWEATRALETL